MRVTSRDGTPGRISSTERPRRPWLLPASVWRWRVAGTAGVLLYLAQDAFDLRWEWLAQLQTIDEFKYATGLCLLSYVGWQWWLFYARLKRRNLRTLLSWHQRMGAAAPLFFYIHSVETGFGYLAVLSWIFLGNLLVGVVSPLGIRINNRYYTASWGTLHVTLAAVTTILVLFHAYIAVYYK